MKKPQKRRIIVKVIRKPAQNIRKGVWKVAYADFVTAMMAFFLLLWLLSISTQQYMRGVAEYFKRPLAVALFGGKDNNENSGIEYSGGRDLTRTSGQVSKGADLDAAKSSLINIEVRNLSMLREQLLREIALDPSMLPYKNQLLIDITQDGLRIQIIDNSKRPMFDMGSAILQPYAARILHAIGNVLNSVQNKVTLAGYTDATPYQGGAPNYDNWDLSMDRANASRRELIAGGMAPDKVLRVTGLASAVPLDRHDPFDPINRRISIVVMKHKARPKRLY
jgi:chemotaxis protein MotB